METYSNFPPPKYFMRVLKNLPKCAWLYVQIWKNRTYHSQIVVVKKNIRKEYLISPTIFRNLLSPLKLRLNVIHFKEDAEKFHIDLFGADGDEKNW